MISFHKYHGTGNDFIMIDDREQQFPVQEELIRDLCTRRFGIGADGLILLQSSASADFKMVYFNADGKEGSLCGNGSRCAVAFAREVGLITRPDIAFEAVDGIHQAAINGDRVKLQMMDVQKIEACHPDYFLDTGSPHYVRMLEHSPRSIDVVQEGRQVRYSDRFREKGTNVNFVQQTGLHEIQVRTYERGVEDETWSCGTGVVASAIASYHSHRHEYGAALQEVQVMTRGGELQVNFAADHEGYRDIWLMGPAVETFEGHIDI